jgi:hypothetical protein
MCQVCREGLNLKTHLGRKAFVRQTIWAIKNLNWKHFVDWTLKFVIEDTFKRKVG